MVVVINRDWYFKLLLYLTSKTSKRLLCISRGTRETLAFTYNLVLWSVKAVSCSNSTNGVVVLPEEAETFVDNDSQDGVVGELKLLWLIVFLLLLLCLLIFC